MDLSSVLRKDAILFTLQIVSRYRRLPQTSGSASIVREIALLRRALLRWSSHLVRIQPHHFRRRPLSDQLSHRNFPLNASHTVLQVVWVGQRWRQFPALLAEVDGADDPANGNCDDADDQEDDEEGAEEEELGVLGLVGGCFCQLSFVEQSWLLGLHLAFLREKLLYFLSLGKLWVKLVFLEGMLPCEGVVFYSY